MFDHHGVGNDPGDDREVAEGEQVAGQDAARRAGPVAQRVLDDVAAARPVRTLSVSPISEAVVPMATSASPRQMITNSAWRSAK